MPALMAKSKRGLLLLIFISIFLSAALKPLFAVPVEGLEEGIYKFLLNQRSDRTGILGSFINSDDITLEGQASTYDMSLAGLGFLQLKDYQSARRILVFFQERWQGKGFCNFFDSETGECGIEHTVHLGPNMWIAVLALQYVAQTGDREFYPLAKKIALWAVGLNHQSGGISMGPFADWGGDWPNVFSAENNLIAYAVFRALYQTEGDEQTKALFVKEMLGIREFINTVVLIKDEQGTLKNVSVGYNPVEGRSQVPACDVVSSLLLVFNPDQLREYFFIDEDTLINFAKEKLLIDADGIKGFDFTDEDSCLKIERPRMVSLEWTMQMACALGWIADFYGASLYIEQANLFAAEVDKKIIKLADMYFYPYATKDHLQVFPFAYWWKTPKGSPERCGAMSATMWRLFKHNRFNPLQL